MQYADVTGVNAPRLGAQTVSHTTAYAKEAEMSRGVIRTVDYVRSTLKGPLAQWLYQAFEMGRKELKETTLYIAPYNGWVTINKDHLPDEVMFDVHGAGGPQEESQKTQKRLQALNLALSMDQLAIQTGRPPTVNLQGAIEQVLREGGWLDLDSVIERSNPAQEPASPVQASPGSALQALTTQ